MKRFNLSGWAVSHPTLILFLMIVLGAAGFFSYERLGRAEDPFFTVKVVNVSAIWPGATAQEMQTQVADPIEKKLQELPFFEKVQTYSKPSFTAMQVTFKDSTPPKDVIDWGRHCEERSDEAIQPFFPRSHGLLRFARNDGGIANEFGCWRVT